MCKDRTESSKDDEINSLKLEIEGLMEEVKLAVETTHCLNDDHIAVYKEMCKRGEEIRVLNQQLFNIRSKGVL